MKVAITFIGTNKYLDFLPRYYENIKEYFLPNTEKIFLVFTDGDGIIVQCTLILLCIYQCGLTCVCKDRFALIDTMILCKGGGESKSKQLTKTQEQLYIVITHNYLYVIQVGGKEVDPLRLAAAKLQPDAASCALRLLDCLFHAEELVNGNPSGFTNSKDPDRLTTIQKLDQVRMKYIYGESHFS